MDDNVKINANYKIQKLLQRMSQLEDESANYYSLYIEYKELYENLANSVGNKQHSNEKNNTE